MPLFGLAEDVIPYQQIEAQEEVPPPYVEVVPLGGPPPEPALVEVPPRGFSEGTRDGHSVYEEMDHDDLDSEPMVEIYPDEQPRRSAPPAVVTPPSHGDHPPVVVVPAAGDNEAPAGIEDRIFRRVSGVPPAPGMSDEVPKQERIYIDPALRRP